MNAKRFGVFLSAALAVLVLGSSARAQSFGIELHNNLMPASGGMAGTSIARPQDVQSALNGNPATLAQFPGTQFGFGGGWTEATYNLSHTGGVLPNVGAFAGKSDAYGSALGNIGISQDLEALGIPATFGIGLMSSAGAGLSWRNVPASNGTTVTMTILDIGMSMAVDVTDRLAVGASLGLGTGTLDAPFVGIGAAAYDYELRGGVGLAYDLGGFTTLGVYYKTRQNFNFDHAISLDLGGGAFSPTFDVNAGLPDNIGIGLANDAFLDGRLLLAADVLYKQWENADLFRSLYQNQWVFQAGMQYAVTPRVRLRMGYAYAENPIDPNVGASAGGVTPPGAVAALQYTQGLLAITNQHRLTGGIGVRDLLPGIDLDLLAGGMFEDSEQLGAFTATSVESYWVGGGLTWRFGRGSCRRLPVADCW